MYELNEIVASTFRKFNSIRFSRLDIDKEIKSITFGKITTLNIKAETCIKN